MEDKNKRAHKDSKGRNIYPDHSEEKLCQWEGCTARIFAVPGSSYKRKYCDRHLPMVRQKSALKARKKKQENQDVENKKEKVVATAPTGESLLFKDKIEAEYYNLRKQAYLKDFDLDTAADTTLLARLLSLEVECLRTEKKLQTKSADKWLQESLTKLTEQIRRVQKDLGVNRAVRQEQGKDRTAQDVMLDMIKKFDTYRQNNPDEFIWRCVKCGHKHVLHRRNNGDYVDTEQPISATPIQ